MVAPLAGYSSPCVMHHPHPSLGLLLLLVRMWVGILLYTSPALSRSLTWGWWLILLLLRWGDHGYHPVFVLLWGGDHGYHPCFPSFSLQACTSHPHSFLPLHPPVVSTNFLEVKVAVCILSLPHPLLIGCVAYHVVICPAVLVRVTLVYIYWHPSPVPPLL